MFVLILKQKKIKCHHWQNMTKMCLNGENALIGFNC